MKRTLSNVLIFAAGAAVGSVVTWRIFKSKYEILDDANINAFIEESYEDIYGEEESEEEEDEDGMSDEDEEYEEYEEYLKSTEHTWAHKPPLKEYAKRVQGLGYSTEVAVADEDDGVWKPYIIHPDQYGEIFDYETISLVHFADGVLADELDNPIEDVEGIVCADYADHFGEYEDDSVWVRNDERQCDYEILRDLRNFADVVGEDPHPSEDE